MRFHSTHSSGRRGFTLVELLVVITIIGVLVGLLMPAVMMAVNEARRAQCEQNLRNVGMALAHYEQNKKFYPGYRQMAMNPINNNKEATSWVPMILEELGHGDIRKQWLNSAGRTSINSDLPHLAVMNCPSDSRMKGKISYRINSGLNNTSTKRTIRYTGIAMNVADGGNDLKVGASQVSDGVSNTVLSAENSNMRPTWTAVDSSNTFNTRLVYSTGTTWPGSGSNVYSINRLMDATITSYEMARPSSRHRGLAHAAFCDGHVQALKESIQYNTYKAIMCPNDQYCNDSEYKTAITNIVDNDYP